MGKWYRAAPVMCAAIVLMAAACTPPTPGPGGPTNLAPIAVATATPTSGNAPLTVGFDAAGSTDPDGSIVSYAWNFGNSTNGTGATASATYTAGGVYNATLTVTDNGGATATSTVTITVSGDGDGDGFFPPADCDDSDPTIYPGAPDEAGDNIDQNCDGIDGEQNEAVFVSSATGANTSQCGTILEPCASIGQGQNRAIAQGKANVFVAGGTYAKFTVQPGLEIRGGYGQNWQRGISATGSTVANVNASFDAAVGGPVAIFADGVNATTLLADLKVTGASAGTGQNSYGVFVKDSTNALTLDSLQVVGGTAGKGADGAAGQGGWSAAATAGGNGGNGF
ncbi:MAG: PKD domain-containing protein, partial [Microthrixaceae bacterium]